MLIQLFWYPYSHTIILISLDVNGNILLFIPFLLDFVDFYSHIWYTYYRTSIRRQKEDHMIKQIGDVIAVRRKALKISQVELAARLKKHNISVSNKLICRWESNTSTISARQFLAVCEVLGITDIYAELIGENPQNPLSGLNEPGRAKLLEYRDLLLLSEDYRERTAEIIPFHRRIPVSLISASAGTGNYLDEENFEMMDVYEPVPDKADFGVYLDGDSMMPEFQDKQLIWIEKTDSLESGELGLFFLDGRTYFKKLKKTPCGAFLISLNAKYQPIPIPADAAFKVFGRLATGT